GSSPSPPRAASTDPVSPRDTATPPASSSTSEPRSARATRHPFALGPTGRGSPTRRSPRARHRAHGTSGSAGTRLDGERSRRTSCWPSREERRRFSQELMLLAQDRQLTPQPAHFLFSRFDPHRSRHRAARDQLLLPVANLFRPKRQLASDLAHWPTQLRDLPDCFFLELVRKDPPYFAHGPPPHLEDRGCRGVRQIEAASLQRRKPPSHIIPLRVSDLPGIDQSAQ